MLTSNGYLVYTIRMTDENSQRESSDFEEINDAAFSKSLIVYTFFILMIWVLYMICVPRYWPFLHDFIHSTLPDGLFDDDGSVNLGTFGDYFGALNCLFAGLAYAAVYVSIKQQSKSINIQQNELRAQLKEMSDSVKESKALNELQRNYQFSDEFFRRINLLKLIEKDVCYNGDKGQRALVSMAALSNKIIELILENKFSQAKDLIVDKKVGLLPLKVSMDAFNVWKETFSVTLDWLYGYMQDVEESKRKEIQNLEDVNIKNKKLDDIHIHMEKMKSSYESVLISSTIWAGQYFLVLDFSRRGNGVTLSSLLEYNNFACGKIGSKVRNEKYRKCFSRLLEMNVDKDIVSQLENIYKKLGPIEID